MTGTCPDSAAARACLCVPSAWHAQHVPDFRLRSHCAWFVDPRRDPVARRARARKLALVRHAQQREPVAGGIVLRRRARIRRDDRRQVERSCRASPASSANRRARSRGPRRCRSPSGDRARRSGRDRRSRRSWRTWSEARSSPR